jgi:hypothetical protein
MIPIVSDALQFCRSLWRYLGQLEDWLGDMGPKPQWPRFRQEQFNSLGDVVEHYLASLPDDEARRKFLAEASAEREAEAKHRATPK